MLILIQMLLKCNTMPATHIRLMQCILSFTCYSNACTGLKISSSQRATQVHSTALTTLTLLNSCRARANTSPMLSPTIKTHLNAMLASGILTIATSRMCSVTLKGSQTLTNLTKCLWKLMETHAYETHAYGAHAFMYATQTSPSLTAMLKTVSQS